MEAGGHVGEPRDFSSSTAATLKRETRTSPYVVALMLPNPTATSEIWIGRGSDVNKGKDR